MRQFTRALTLLLVLLPILAARGQLTPGKLAAPHKQLEGLTRCTQCHELGKPIDGSRCLACHGALDARIKARKGWHAQERVRSKACISCHSDHHGLDYKMIYWDKGQAAFVHAETGWELKGRHAELKCRDCHRKELVREELKRSKGSDPSRTFMGLGTACLACHRDEHQGQLGDDCASCHTAAAWNKTTFDHDQARFALAGAHARLACDRCHKPEIVRAAAGRFVVETKAAGLAARFKPLPFARCTDCHQDPHGGRLGADCLSCHTAASFTGSREGFDHSRTRYPLTGAHVRVECAKCHKGSEPARSRPRSQDCAPCHQDPHQGQLGKAAGQSCSTCHDTERFSPSGYGVARHQEGRAPLAGAHQAVACGDCHTRKSPQEPVRYDLGGRGFSGQACADCHQDAHQGQAKPWMGEAGCLDCHGLEQWAVKNWDHDRAAFKLGGRHIQVACVKCHKSAEARHVPFKGLAKDCAGCHQDPHRGQLLAASETRPDCARCHSSADWKETHFSHDNSRFPLDGQHKNLACLSCHKPERDEQGDFIRYKPLGIRCEDCHGATPGE